MTDKQDLIDNAELEDVAAIRRANVMKRAFANEHCLNMKQQGLAFAAMDAALSAMQPDQSQAQTHTEELEPLAIESMWRQAELPEYFLGNGGSNHRLYKFVALVRSSLTPASHSSQARVKELEGGLASYGWQPINTAPLDCSKGDFFISLFNNRGDCLWVKLIRHPLSSAALDPKTHMGLKLASHWMLVPPVTHALRAGSGEAV